MANDFLAYILAMAMGDGLISPHTQGRYLRKLQDEFEDTDMEAEYELIVNKESRLPAAKRRRIVALVEYARDKERLGPETLKASGDGRFM